MDSKAVIVGGMILLIAGVSGVVLLSAQSGGPAMPECSNQVVFKGTRYCYETLSLRSFPIGANVTFRGVTFGHTYLASQPEPSWFSYQIYLGGGEVNGGSLPFVDGATGGGTNSVNGHKAWIILFPSNETIRLMTTT